MCDVITNLKKYKERPSPPRAANEPGCRGLTFPGNDGNLWVSKADSRGIYRWYKVSGAAAAAAPKKAKAAPKAAAAAAPKKAKAAPKKAKAAAAHPSGPIHVRLPVPVVAGAAAGSGPKPCKKVCSAIQLCNPYTGRCVSKTGAVGKKLANEMAFFNRLWDDSY